MAALRPIEHQINRIYRQITYTYNICRSLQARLLRELESPHFLSRNAEDLTAVLNDLTSSMLRQLQDDFTSRLNDLWKLSKSFVMSASETNFPDTRIKVDQLERDLYHVTEIASNLTPLIEYILGAKSETNPWSVVSLLDQTCRRLYSDSRIIVLPRWEHNYSYVNITDELMRWAQYARNNGLEKDRKSTRLNSSHIQKSRMPSSA